ncbi:hydrogenase formation protein HypD [Nguyenibacter vanlangensis]|uniref:Hydrogenase maturation factor n=2 Tax=Nguyenibacter vanlangensis TaxID=1216886 RepID=A0A7Y7IUH6_9PROT|nr:hydrogenase formation protein HypD [Nguyenibacter vanlangensis]
MKYMTEYRDGHLARALAETLAREADPHRDYRIMEFCGGHTHAIARYGIEDMLPRNVRMVHGPGCPICVLPVGRIEDAIRLAGQPGITLCTYADLMRVPTPDGGSLLRARAAGADIRMVYSTHDALQIAETEPERRIVFLAVGFETTTPPTALAILNAKERNIFNFSILCNHVLTPPAIRAILDNQDVAIDGLVGPAHVSTVIGTSPYEDIAARFSKPVVVTGFEPLDVLQGIVMLVRQMNAGRCVVENQYRRAVIRGGNLLAQRAIADVFEIRESFAWRGLGEIPYSALRLNDRHAAFDAERRYGITTLPAADNPACACGDVLRGVRKPTDCRLFGTVCSPETPIGSCMVSPEGACAAHWTYKRFRDKTPPGARDR